MDCIIRKRTTHVRVDMKPEKLFKRYEKVVCAAARGVAHSTGKAHQEMAEEAISRLAEVSMNWQDFYDPHQGASGTTWLTIKIRSYLRDFCRKQLRRREVEIPDNGAFHARSNSSYNVPSHLENIWRDLGDEARHLLRIVFDAPADIAATFRGIQNDPIRARMALMDHLRTSVPSPANPTVLGWSDEEIDRAWSEVQSCLQ